MGLRRVRAVLKLKKNNVPVLLAQAKAIHAAMSANQAIFTAPNPPLATLLTQIEALDAAEQATHTKAKGTAAVRNTKRNVLISSLELERAYVQSLADASPEEAVAIIEAASMKVAASPRHAKEVLGAKLGQPPGTVILDANAGLLGRGTKQVCFNWLFSTDGGKTWISAPSTPLPHTSITGLPLLTVCSFRVNISDADGPTAWSQAVSILVH